TGLSKSIFKNANFQFIKYRKYAYMVSGLILLLGIGTIFNGFKQGVEFSGGRSFIVKFDGPQNSEEIRASLNDAFGESPIVKTYGIGSNQFDITTDYLINQEGLSTDSTVRNALFAGLKGFLPQNLTAEQFEKNHILQ